MGSTTVPVPAPEGWRASRYRGGEASRDYVCPGCQRAVVRRSEHIVASRTDADDARHRHWHTACWQTAVREGIDRYRWL